MRDMTGATLRDEIKRASERISPITITEVLDRPSVWADAEPDEHRGDDLMVDYLQQRPDRTKEPSEQKGWISVLVVVAATILVVVGVVVVADGDSGNVVTDPASSPSADDSVPSSEGSGVAEDQPVLGGPGVQIMHSVTVGGPGLVAVGEDSPNNNIERLGSAAVWTSVDGFTWSRVPHDEAIFGTGGALMFDVTVGGPGLVAVGGEGDFFAPSDGVVWTSVDGLIWSRVPHDEAVFGGGWITSVTVAGPGLVAVGSVNADNEPDYGTGGDAAVWTSVDGITWSRVPHDDAVFGGADKQWIDSVTVGGPGLVAVGTDGKGWWDYSSGLVAAVWTSVDGIAWSRVPHDDEVFGRLDYESDHERSNEGMTSVTAVGPGLVAVGVSWYSSHAGVWTSVDGITWSRGGGVMTEVAEGAHGVAELGTGLVAVGSAVWTSVDGITWSRVPHDEEVFGEADDHWMGEVIVGGSRPGGSRIGSAGRRSGCGGVDLG